MQYIIGQIKEYVAREENKEEYAKVKNILKHSYNFEFVEGYMYFTFEEWINSRNDDYTRLAELIPYLLVCIEHLSMFYPKDMYRNIVLGGITNGTPVTNIGNSLGYLYRETKYRPVEYL